MHVLFLEIFFFITKLIKILFLFEKQADGEGGGRSL